MVEVVQLMGSQLVEANRSERWPDVVFDAATVLLDRVGQSRRRDVGQPPI
jgi:hypothetical protein